MIYSLIFLLSLFILSYSSQIYPLNLIIGQNKFQLDINPEKDNLNIISRNFCINQQDKLGYNKDIPLTESNINDCIIPIVNGIKEQLNILQKQQQNQQNQQQQTKQQDKQEDLYRVNVPVNGNVFEVRFRPATEPIQQVARNFCITQRELLGYNDSNPLTDANLPNCVGPIANYIQTAIAQYQQQQQQKQAPVSPPAPPAPTAATQRPIEIKVRIPVEGNLYEISLREGQYIADVARNFCIEQASSLGYTPNNPLTEQNIGSCMTPVGVYLQNTLAEYSAQQQQKAATAAAPQQQQQQQQAAPQENVYAIRINIDSNLYEIRFNPTRETFSQAAQNFCVTQAESLKVTSDTLENCVNLVGNYLRQSMNQQN